MFTTQKESSTATAGPIVTAEVRVNVVDPAAYTPPYDQALCAALARGRRRRRARHGAVRARRGAAPARGYTVREDFYRFAPQGAWPALGAPGQHIPDMLRAVAPATADVVHFQWLAVQPLDAHLLRAYARRSS